LRFKINSNIIKITGFQHEDKSKEIQVDRSLVSAGLWFQGDHYWGKPKHAQDRVQCCTVDAWFNFPIKLPSFHWKYTPFQQISLFITSRKHIQFSLAFGTLFVFCEAEFHKIKNRETLSRSHNDFNTTNNNEQLRASPCPLSCTMYTGI
jgi:hypothetical protein